MDAVETARLIRDRKMSAEEAVSEAIARAKKVDGALNAIVADRFGAALAEARSARDDAAGPLSGVPTLLKDFSTPAAGEPEIEGNVLLRDLGLKSDHDSAVVTKLREGGLIWLGRTHSPEFAAGKCGATAESEAFGATRNPWSPGLTAMGSSGGSAAAVAAGIVPVAHGNDGGGSIRMPASACGIVGLKSTRGRISWGPDCGELRNGAATQGMLSRTVRDTAASLDVLSGYVAGDHYTAPPPERPFLDEIGRETGHLRIGVCSEFPHGPVDAACIEAVEKTAAVLSDMGHHVERAWPGDYFDLQAILNHRNYVCASIAWTLDAYAMRIGRAWTQADMESGSWDAYQAGKAMSAADYVRTVAESNRYSRRMAAWWEGDGAYDLLLTPTLSAPPPKLGFLIEGEGVAHQRRVLQLVAFTMQFNITGQPAISLPLHWTDQEVPVGVQFVAKFAADALLIRLAYQLEQAMPWADRRPPIFAD